MTGSKPATTPNAVGYCSGCRREMFGSTTARRFGMLAHDGKGRCEYCASILRGTDQDRIDLVLAGKLVVTQQTVDISVWLDRPILGGDWRSRAACRGTDDPRFHTARSSEDVAREFCADCPVLDLCAAEADAYGYVGMWAAVFRSSNGHGRKETTVSAELTRAADRDEYADRQASA